MNPKVFISHASEDKDRFVVDFAKKLRQNGIDAWLDRWEMLPGDSLVDKIFNEGLKDAAAIVVVLSKTSVSKPWVSEELNAGIVSRISRGTKIIPVVIDTCEVPDALKSTLWEKVENTSNYDASLRRIVAAIFETREKPAIGSVPQFVLEGSARINGLSRVDSMVLRKSALFDLERNAYVISPDSLFEDIETLGITREQIKDSLNYLADLGYLELTQYIGNTLDSYGCSYRLTAYGLERYCETDVDGYSDLKKKCVSLIVNEDILDNETISTKTGARIRLISHIIDTFEGSNLLKASKSLNGRVTIYDVSAKFRRMIA